jgi:hypothetical protein
MTAEYHGTNSESKMSSLGKCLEERNYDVENNQIKFGFIFFKKSQVLKEFFIFNIRET